MIKHASFEDFFDTCTPYRRKLFESIRSFIVLNFPELKEEIKYGYPFYTCKGMVAYFTVYSKQKEPGVYVGLCQGTLLKDPDGLLSGEGNTIKRMYFNGPEDIEAEGLATLGAFLGESIFINELKSRKR